MIVGRWHETRGSPEIVAVPVKSLHNFSIKLPVLCRFMIHVFDTDRIFVTFIGLSFHNSYKYFSKFTTSQVHS